MKICLRVPYSEEQLASDTTPVLRKSQKIFLLGSLATTKWDKLNPTAEEMYVCVWLLFVHLFLTETLLLLFMNAVSRGQEVL